MGMPLKILGLLKADPKLTPAMICRKLSFHYSSVNSCLWIMKDLGLVKNLNHGLYVLTEKGLKWLEEAENP